MSDEYGPNGDAVRDYLSKLLGLTHEQWDAAWAAACDAAWDAAWDAARDAARGAAWAAARDAARGAARAAARYAAWDAAWDAARDAARGAACDAARDAACDAARDAAVAIVVRDLISQEHFDILTAPMRRAAGIDFDTTKETTK